MPLQSYPTGTWKRVFSTFWQPDSFKVVNTEVKLPIFTKLRPSKDTIYSFQWTLISVLFHIFSRSSFLAKEQWLISTWTFRKVLNFTRQPSTFTHYLFIQTTTSGSLKLLHLMSNQHNRLLFVLNYKPNI